MEIREYLTIFWRRKWVIMCTFIVTLAVVIVATNKTTPIFTATSMLRVATSPTGTISYTDYQYANRLMNTYSQLATTNPVLDELKQRLGLTYLPKIGVEIVPDTELLQIQVEHQNPTLAAQIANTLADILVSQSVELYTGSGKSSLEILNEQLQVMEDELNQARKEYTALVAKNPNDTITIQTAKQSLDSKQQIYDSILNEYEQARIRAALREKSISIVEPAVPPVSPSKPNVMLNITLGGLVALLGGSGLAILFENFDTTLYSTEQIEKVTELPILGTVPNTDIRKQLISMNGNNPYIDAFRRLRSKLLALDQDLPCHTILVTSAEPGDGKSTLVTNLAYVLARAGRKVVVIDCDLRIPTLYKIFKLPNEQGLCNVLLNQNDIEDVLQDCSVPGVKVVTSGPLASNPAELLGSQEMISLIYRLRQHWDNVLLDSPAMISTPDAIVLTPAVDGVIMVVSRSHSQREDVRSACTQLTDVKARILGVVINRAGKNRGYYYKYHPEKIVAQKG